MSLEERKQKILNEIKERRKANKSSTKSEADDQWEEVDDHEKEVYATTGYYEVPEDHQQISSADMQLLQGLNKNEKTLADVIMQKLKDGDYLDGDKLLDEDAAHQSDLDPKVIATYKKVGVVMKSFKSGKLPKAFKIIP